MAKLLVNLHEYRRPCIVYGPNGKEKGLFHCVSVAPTLMPANSLKGEDKDFIIYETVAVVEFEDGSIKKILTENIKFDDGGKFADFAWRSDCEGEDYDEYESDKENWDSVWNEQDRWEEGFDPGDFELEEE